MNEGPCSKVSIDLRLTQNMNWTRVTMKSSIINALSDRFQSKVASCMPSLVLNTGKRPVGKRYNMTLGDVGYDEGPYESFPVPVSPPSGYLWAWALTRERSVGMQYKVMEEDVMREITDLFRFQRHLMRKVFGLGH